MTSPNTSLEDRHKFDGDFCEDDIHGLFGLTYANYLTIPRSILQSMPADWQHEFVQLVEQMEELYSGYEMDYSVYKRNEKGQFVSDPLSNYERGRRYIEPRTFMDNLEQAKTEVTK